MAHKHPLFSADARTKVLRGASRRRDHRVTAPAKSKARSRPAFRGPGRARTQYVRAAIALLQLLPDGHPKRRAPRRPESCVTDDPCRATKP